MRLFRRRASDPAPQLVSLAPIDTDMDYVVPVPPPAPLSPTSITSNYNSSEAYADYQTVTALPALVVQHADDGAAAAPRKGQIRQPLSSFFCVLVPSSFCILLLLSLSFA